ncbi:sec-independent protein translocase protein TatB [Chromobacterium alkanivorans]|uniref:Sec-independent protein translocase protein TatB n=1 Tax=Chromobacterium TaxID=535 RepID=UPI000653B8D8|nr:Sec-independent protein translocase protein TatB [Chromobacterium sp. LK11]KMN82871.1 preprotein translocase subunit TatB [Chromobacterium sp. LK11]MCS3803430.1 sec-independent protein translocase protein TatB [Chromobacterium alkanivorans]MCS3817460.1 sec-independent protein translocase protein TatB [Chromobacterium alkanivorans]MCS3872796.1 sec-independent protein translocase protein TatB [Chromobacterium alkanivorans]
MFEISFGEILLIGVVALVVLGPERLPTVARTLGALVGRAQRFVATVKADIQQQANLTGLNELRQDIEDAAQSFKGQLDSEVRGVREAMEQNGAELRALADEARAPVDEAVNAIHGGLQPDLLDPLPADVEAQAEAAPVKDENQLDLFDDLPPAKPAPQPADPPSLR